MSAEDTGVVLGAIIFALGGLATIGWIVVTGFDLGEALSEASPGLPRLRIALKWANITALIQATSVATAIELLRIDEWNGVSSVLNGSWLMGLLGLFALCYPLLLGLWTFYSPRIQPGLFAGHLFRSDGDKPGDEESVG